MAVHKRESMAAYLKPERVPHAPARPASKRRPASGDPKPPPRLYTVAEVAARFRVDPKTVGRWHHDGKLPNVRIIRTPGGHRRFNADDIDALIEDQDT